MITLTYANGVCVHSSECNCPILLQGVPGTPAEALDAKIIRGRDKKDQCELIAAYISSRFALQEGQLVMREGDMFKYLAKNKLQESKNMQVIPPPIPNKGQMLETWGNGNDPRIKDILKAADKAVLRKYFPLVNFAILHSPEEQVDAYHMEVRKRSAYWSAYGTSGGHPFVIPALKDANGMKTIQACFSYSRNTRELSEAGANAVKHASEAMQHLYAHMGYSPDQLGTKTSILDFESLSDCYLGSSAGLRPGETARKVLELGEVLHVSATGKKAEVFHSDLDLILHYLETGMKFDAFFTMVGKMENRFKFEGLEDPKVYEAFVSKMRLFNIPTSTFVLAEQLVSKTRMLSERGNVIQIGMKWSRGGAQYLARCLGIDKTNHWKKILVEGDLKNMDQSVHAFFVQLYMETMLVHEDPESVDYGAKVKLLELITPIMVNRLTRLFSDVWVKHYGGVPSGCFNTSHMDSWVMCMYFFLFMVQELHRHTGAEQEAFAELMEFVRIVVYGDDHLYNKGEHRMSHLLSGKRFETFLRTCFDVELKDIYDGIPFLSVTDRGCIVKRGATFLKEQFVINPYASDAGQAEYLPFRETREVMIRLAWGRETNYRDLSTFLLSTIGHAYGTYAANRVTYDLLEQCFHEAMSIMSLSHVKYLPDIDSFLMGKSMRKIRQSGLTKEDLIKGFPSWITLVELNRYDEAYHMRIRQEDFQLLDPEY